MFIFHPATRVDINELRQRVIGPFHAHYSQPIPRISLDPLSVSVTIDHCYFIVCNTVTRYYRKLAISYLLTVELEMYFPRNGRRRRPCPAPNIVNCATLLIYNRLEMGCSSQLGPHSASTRSGWLRQSERQTRKKMNGPHCVRSARNAKCVSAEDFVVGGGRLWVYKIACINIGRACSSSRSNPSWTSDSVYSRLAICSTRFVRLVFVCERRMDAMSCRGRFRMCLFVNSFPAREYVCLCM